MASVFASLLQNCKPLQNGVPGDGYRGGRHGNIKKGGNSYDPPRESHHMPADSTYSQINGSPVSSDNKPAIQMDKADHQKTASHDHSSVAGSAKAYRNTQESLMKQGKVGYLAAMMMDVADIKSKFGNKYDSAILQMMAWAKCMGHI